VAVAPAGTLAGAESCREKLLVMATATEICFEGSATLCAVNVALAGDAEFAARCTCRCIHRSAPAAASRAREAPAHRRIGMAVTGGRGLKWLRRAEFHTLAGFGAKFNEISLVIAKLPLPDFVESAWLVAVTSTVAGDGRSAGAV